MNHEMTDDSYHQFNENWNPPGAPKVRKKRRYGAPPPHRVEPEPKDAWWAVYVFVLIATGILGAIVWMATEWIKL